MSTGPGDGSFELAERELRMAKLDLFARRAGLNAAATAVNSLLLAVLLYRTAPIGWLGCWAALQLGGSAWAYFRSRRKRRPPRGSPRGLRLATSLCTAAGLLLGSVVLLLDGAPDFARIITLLTLGAMASAASTTLAPIPSAARGYILGALVLPAALWLYRGRIEYALLAGLALSMAFFLVRNARVTHEAFLEGIGRAEQLGSMRTRFLAERAEWLDLSRATEAFVLLDEAGQVMLWNTRFEQLVRPALVERGVTYASLLEGAEATPVDVDGQAVTRAAWLWQRAALLEQGGELLEGYAGDVFYRVSAHQVKSGRRVVLLVNVSALKQAERALFEREMALLRTQRQESVGVLAGGVAHDFNNLLTAVGGAAELLSSSVSSEEGRGLLEDIATSVERGARLTRQLLAYGRRQSHNPKPLRLNDLLQRSLPLFRRLLPATVRLDSELGSDLWFVNADAEQMEQVAVNLVLNARDAMPNGGTLTVCTRNTGEGSVEFSVTDTGIGMTDETLEHIFEPFFSTKEQHHGSGLGLSAVHGIVRQSGGSIAVQSRLGEGTRMTVHLPSCDPPTQQLEVQVRPRSYPVARSQCLLVVDDEQAVLEVTARLLRRYGYQVLVALGANVAREVWAAQGERISMLLTDVVMPGSNGAELAAELRRSRPELPVLFMSGYDPGLLARFEAREVLQKPFTPDQLARAVAEGLAHVPAPCEATAEAG